MVASVGYDAITQHDVIQEYHFERFLNGQTPEGAPTDAESQAVLSRLISQTLLTGQMRATTRESRNGKKTAEDTLNAIKKKFSGEEAYRSALESLGMTEDQVLQRLELYQRTLQMINNRLRPAALPDPKAVEDYYKNTFVPEYARTHGGSPPSFDNVQDQIREILVQEKMNQLLDDWLTRLKSSHRVTIHSE